MPYDDEELGLCLLEALFDLARADTDASPARLAEWLEVPLPRIERLLARLDAQALVDASRCRLTMQGLVLAVSHEGSRKLAKHAA